MNAKNRLPFVAVLPLLAWLSLIAGACITQVQAAGSRTGTATPTPTITATSTAVPLPWTGTATPTPTTIATITAEPSPLLVCTIEWAWRDAGLTITKVDLSRLDGLAPGDIILMIDGRDAEAFIVEIETGLGGIGDPVLRRALALDAILHGSDVLFLLVRHGQTPAYYYNLVPGCHL